MNLVTSAGTFAFASLAVLFASSTAFAQYTDGVVKIGVLTDMSSLYADDTGLGSVAAAKLAVEDAEPGMLACDGVEQLRRIRTLGRDLQSRPRGRVAQRRAHRRPGGDHDPDLVLLRRVHLF